jgi:lauroyl/myristoyl acyltransferase
LVESGADQFTTDVRLARSDASNARFRGGAGWGLTNLDTALSGETHRWWHGFAVQGILWRRFIDWAVVNVPAPLHRPLIWVSTFVFFFIAAPARKAVLRHLRIVLPDSFRLVNYLRTLRIFANFGWMLTDAAVYRLLKPRFNYEFDGEDCLQELASAPSAIVLTAHMGNYDLGAALFAEKFQRQIHVVRAPEPDALAAQHVDLSLQQSSAGGVKVDYSSVGTSLAFDLLNALRAGDIISIQGDRVIGEVARSTVTFLGREVLLPTGPFVLSLVSGAPIYPLFMVRAGYRKYRIIVRPPITCLRGGRSREEEIAEAMQRWSHVLEENVRRYWPQWYTFVPLFDQTPVKD